MCRLYGFRASAPTKVECGLVLAQNSLLAQSRSDSRGTSHADGWGIATYPNGAPQVERRASAAFQGLHFGTVAERVYARTVVAHVRNATVGAQRRENAHPFRWRTWIFAHNGTVRMFDAVRPILERATNSAFGRLSEDSSDSEVIFHWLLSRMHEADIDLDSGGSSPDAVAGELATAVRDVERICQREGAEEPSRLNWILTDGSLLLASRWHSELHLLIRHGVHDCEICGIPHIDTSPGEDYRAVVVASEPISDEDWKPIPEASVLVVSPDLQAEIRFV